MEQGRLPWGGTETRYRPVCDIKVPLHLRQLAWVVGAERLTWPFCSCPPQNTAKSLACSSTSPAEMLECLRQKEGKELILSKPGVRPPASPPRDLSSPETILSSSCGSRGGRD